MLIDGKRVKELLDKHGIQIHGVFHIGAHDCEELPFYTNILNVSRDAVVWIDAIPKKVEECKRKGIELIYQGVITDKDDEDIVFNVSNNVQSSSILEFGTHAKNHSWVHFVDKLNLKTVTIDTFFQRTGLDAKGYDFWNLDIQGAELLALRGAEKSLEWPRAIYLEVNTEEVYKGCGLLWEIDALLSSRGFVRVETQITHANWGDALYIKVV